MHLPDQLAQVDPIVASFCGGAVGVLSTLLLVEVNNTDRQAAQRCVYCEVRQLILQAQCLSCNRQHRVHQQHWRWGQYLHLSMAVHRIIRDTQGTQGKVPAVQASITGHVESCVVLSLQSS